MLHLDLSLAEGYLNKSGGHHLNPEHCRLLYGYDSHTAVKSSLSLYFSKKATRVVMSQ